MTICTITAQAGQNGKVDDSNIYHGDHGYYGGGGHLGPYQGGTDSQDGNGPTGGSGTLVQERISEITPLEHGL